MGIEQLTQILSPPENPMEVPLVRDWTITEMITGKLPRDYRLFLETYGTGQINNFLYLYNPASMNPHMNLLKKMWEVLEGKKQIRKEFPEAEPLPLFPEPNGLLPLGVTDNGDEIFWRTRGNPERWNWRVIVWESRSPEWQEFDTDLSGFLFNILSGKEPCRIFPDNFPRKNNFFTPLKKD